MADQVIAEVDLRGASEKELSYLESEAVRRGVSFEEASKQLLLEHVRALKRKQVAVTVAQLFRRSTAH